MGTANTFAQMATIEFELGNLDKAKQLYDEVMEIFQQIGDQSGIAKTLHQLGRINEKGSL